MTKPPGGAAVVDKYTGKPVSSAGSPTWTRAGRASRETVDQDPGRPDAHPPTGAPFELVKFEGLQVTPWVTRAGARARAGAGRRMAFSLRATGFSRPAHAKQDAA